VQPREEEDALGCNPSARKRVQPQREERDVLDFIVPIVSKAELREILLAQSRRVAERESFWVPLLSKEGLGEVVEA